MMSVNCKINLGLNIVRKRPDGYHDLETVFYPTDYYTDKLTLEDSAAPENPEPEAQAPDTAPGPQDSASTASNSEPLE